MIAHGLRLKIGAGSGWPNVKYRPSTDIENYTMSCVELGGVELGHQIGPSMVVYVNRISDILICHMSQNWAGGWDQELLELAKEEMIAYATLHEIVHFLGGDHHGGEIDVMYEFANGWERAKMFFERTAENLFRLPANARSFAQ